MKLQTVAVSALLGYTSAAVYGGRNKEWPSWATADKATLANPVALVTDGGQSNVACARS